jgi:hypothetical protein
MDPSGRNSTYKWTTQLPQSECLQGDEPYETLQTQIINQLDSSSMTAKQRVAEWQTSRILRSKRGEYHRRASIKKDGSDTSLLRGRVSPSAVQKERCASSFVRRKRSRMETIRQTQQRAGWILRGYHRRTSWTMFGYVTPTVDEYRMSSEQKGCLSLDSQLGKDSRAEQKEWM